MITLMIEGIEADISPNTSIEFFKSYAWLFEDGDGDYTFTFSLAYTPTNNIIFKYANEGDIEDVDNSFAAVVKIFGNVWQNGEIKLNKCNRTGYEVVFVAATSIIAPERYLHEVIDYTVTVSDPVKNNWLPSFLSTPNDFYFPHLARNDNFFNRYSEFPFGVGGFFATDVPVSPCFNLRNTLSELCKAVGYQAIFVSNTKMDELYKLIFVTGTDIRDSNITGQRIPGNELLDTNTLPASFNLKDHLPWITINDFLKGLYFHFGVMVLFDTVKKVANVINYTSVSANFIDLTDYVEPFPEVDFDDDKGVTIGFNIDGNDLILADEPKDLEAYEGRKIDVNNETMLELLDPSYDTWAGLNRRLNKWMIHKDNPSGSDWYDYATPRFPFKIGSGASKIEIPWMPVCTENYTLLKLNKITLRNNGSGKVRLTYQYPTYFSVAFTNGKVRLDDSNEYDKEIYYDVVIVGIGATLFFDLDLNYTIDEDIEEATARKTYAKYNPILFYRYNRMPTIQQEESEDKDIPRVAIYHGLRPDSDLTSNYPYASSYNVDMQNNIVGDYALRLYGEEVEDSALHFFHQDKFAIYNDYRLFKWYAHLPAHLIWTLTNLTKFVKIRNTLYLLLEFNQPLSDSDKIETSELKLLKI